MSITSTIRALSKRLSVGNTAYFDCPNCQRKKKLGVTKFVDKIVYQCFASSCNIKGALTIAPTKESISSNLNKQIIQKNTEFKEPDYLINGFASEDSVKLAIKYDLIDAYRDGLFKSSYDPRLHRQVFYHTNDKNEVVGLMGRALNDKTFPKAHIYQHSEKTPWIIGNYKTAIIVEDILSAIKIYNIGYTGIALSGTALSLEYIGQLKRFDRLIIALDKDASIKAIKLKKLLDFYCKSVVILLIEKDFKDMTREEASKLVEEIL